MSSPSALSAVLGDSGRVATWEPSPLVEGAWMLLVGGAEQSTVVPGQPRRLVYEYLRRIGNVVDAAAPAHRALRVLHLGGGALSLPRYVDATRPGSTQLVVDYDAELLPFVLETMPWPDADPPRVVVGDAREALGALRREAPFDVTVLDIALDQHSPRRLLETSFAAELLAATASDGVVCVNVGDDPGLPATRRLVYSFRLAGASVWVCAAKEMFEGALEGNLVLCASRRRWSRERLDALKARGPHPSGLLVGLELDSLGALGEP